MHLITAGIVGTECHFLQFPCDVVDGTNVNVLICVHAIACCTCSLGGFFIFIIAVQQVGASCHALLLADLTLWPVVVVVVVGLLTSRLEGSIARVLALLPIAATSMASVATAAMATPSACRICRR